MDIRKSILLITIGVIIGFFISYFVTSDIKEYSYEVKSKKLKAKHDSLQNVYSKQIDSLNGVINTIDDSIQIIDNRIDERKTKDSANYNLIMQASPDSSYLIIRNYLDSLHSREAIIR